MPDVPWVFLYRDPVEMMVSIQKKSTGWSRSYDNPQIVRQFLGIDPKPTPTSTIEEYWACAIDSMFSNALNHADGRELFLNYAQFGPDLILDIANHFQMNLNSADKEAIQQSLTLYSKDRERKKAFVPDSKQKRAEASEEINEAAKLAGESYQQLEAHRLRQ